MKTKIFTTLLAGVSALGVSTLSVSTQAFAQNRSNISRSIDDDGRNLSIRVNGILDGRAVDFEKTLDVRGLTTKEKTVLTDRILDSLGVARISYTVDEKNDNRRPRYEYSRRENQAPARENEIHRNSDEVVVSTQNDLQSEVVSDAKSLKKEIWTDDNGFLYIRYKFMRGKDEFIIEKSTEVKGMTESGKQRFIKDFEKELELPVM